MLSNDHEEMRFLLRNHIPTNSDHFLFRDPYLYKSAPKPFPWLRVLIVLAIVFAGVAFALGAIDTDALFDRCLWVK